jgi:Tfp pilus assembly protein PilN
MNPFEMVVLIVAIVTLGSVIRNKNGTRRNRRGAAPVEEQMENQLLRSEIKDLKERIAVLERLATDTHSAAALDREIEKLR